MDSRYTVLGWEWVTTTDLRAIQRLPGFCGRARLIGGPVDGNRRL